MFLRLLVNLYTMFISKSAFYLVRLLLKKFKNDLTIRPSIGSSFLLLKKVWENSFEKK